MRQKHHSHEPLRRPHVQQRRVDRVVPRGRLPDVRLGGWKLHCTTVIIGNCDNFDTYCDKLLIVIVLAYYNYKSTTTVKFSDIMTNHLL